MKSEEIRKKFLDFFKGKNHKIIPSSPLIPADSTVLFTIAGMQQFNLALAGEEDPLEKFGSRILVSCQKCFRTIDIEEVGDDTHHTFFEMLGNWSIGEGYFKKKAIEYALEFFGDVLKLEKDRIWVTIFKGAKGISKDEDSIQIWQENGIPKERIKEFGMEDNFWGPVTETGPCGPCSEVYFDRGEDFGCGGKDCGPNCPNCQRFVELWNLVFMEYNKERDGRYVKLPKKNVDTGIGFERLVTILQEKESTYETDLFLPLVQRAEDLSTKTYKEDKKSFRIVVDHIRGAVFLISEGVLPGNLGRGYILRRILRRSIKYAKVLGLKDYWYVPLIKETIKIYEKIYPEIRRKETDIINVVQKEEEKFKKTLGKGLIQFEKLLKTKIKEQKSKIIGGKEVFDLYQSYGFPMELTKELAEEKGFQVDEKGFQKKFKQHQKISRIGVKKKFGGHGISKVETEEEKKKIIKLHTATHLLQQALRQILGKEVEQRGSDINKERLRFDFSYNRKLTPEEIKKVEDLVNQKIKKNLEVKEEEMSLERAINSGALSFFKEKYSNVVKVYTIFDPEITEIFSKEICGGPHVKKTSELGFFQIIKEESSGANTRRIKAILK